ncbi:MAG: hypothetical protein Q4D85_02155 [Corynebacterium sp.]|uniref:hypothetical protein n=1 Tax=Corynebacterium sp. TaxID=1720 RepID=UPI0026DBED44|nr:hypothetical protein [Corynebacterium sp.]MDO5097532.1 hypothetical protein [Corynebacterium sp.]
MRRTPTVVVKTTPIALTAVAVLSATALTGCADRLEPPTPENYSNTFQLAEWSTQEGAIRSIPPRSLQAYAYASVTMSESGCDVGWQTLAAIGYVASNHGFIAGATVDNDGTTSRKLRDLKFVGNEAVADTDEGMLDGDPTMDVGMGPMQIKATAWEKFGESAQPDTVPSPDNIDDASLAIARQLCAKGSLNTPAAWDNGMKLVNPNPDFIKAVHAKAHEYSKSAG